MSDGETFDAAAWREELLGHREEKDRFFADHPQSPVPEEDREGFEGLPYYEPDPAYRVTATAAPVEAEDTLELEMTQGEPRTYERVARLVFDLADEERSLYAYRPAEAEDDGSLFVPFRDATTGDTTYGAGRYMEFEVEGEVEPGTEVPLDFNLAYHPFCVYNEAFACPLTPPENTLEVPVEAGERLARSVGGE